MKGNFMSEDKKQADTKTLKTAYHRFGNLINEMINASNEGDKARIIHVSESLTEHAEDVVAFFYGSNDVTVADIEKMASSQAVDQNLIRLAARPDGDGYMKRRSEVDSRRD
jgi:hypothetical protein